MFTSCYIDCSGTGLSASCSDGIFSGSCACKGIKEVTGDKLNISINKSQLVQIESFYRYFSNSDSKNIKSIASNLDFVAKNLNKVNVSDINERLKDIERTYNACSADEKGILNTWITKSR